MLWKFKLSVNFFIVPVNTQNTFYMYSQFLKWRGHYQTLQFNPKWWFPTKKSSQIMQYPFGNYNLKEHFRGLCTRSRGSIGWLARAPKLSSLGFLLWSHLKPTPKSSVSKNMVQNVREDIEEIDFIIAWMLMAVMLNSLQVDHDIYTWLLNLNV